MKKQLLVLLIFSLTSCSYFLGPQIEIINNSDFHLKEVVVYTSDEFSAINFENLSSGDYENARLDMTESAHHKRDGAYGIRYTFRGQDEKQINAFGYFSNGHATHDRIKIEIKNDTTIFTYE